MNSLINKNPKSSWTESQRNIIINNFPNMTLTNIWRSFPDINLNHAYYATRTYTQRNLKLKRSRKISRIPVKNTYNQEYFKDLTLTKAFVAGMIAGDGCLMLTKYNRYVFSYKVAVKDECIIDFLIKEFDFKGPKQYSTGRSPHYPDRISHFISITMQCFDKNAEYLKQYYNLTPNKTKRLGPTNLTDTNLNLTFIIGNIDADGTIATRRYKGQDDKEIYIHWCSASPDIIRWIKNMMDDLFPAEKYSKTGRIAEIGYMSVNQGNYCRYQIGGLRAAVIINYLNQFPVPKLERKWANPEIINYISQRKNERPELFYGLNFDPHLLQLK